MSWETSLPGLRNNLGPSSGHKTRIRPDTNKTAIILTHHFNHQAGIPSSMVQAGGCRLRTWSVNQDTHTLLS